MKRLFLLFAALISAAAFAQANTDRVSAGGYYRIMARPDFQGGIGRLGFWNLYGRLLNEDPFASLELKLDMLQAPPGSSNTTASIHAKIEGGTVANADTRNGSLAFFRLAQLYADVGNVFLDHVTWRLGTLEYFFGGDLSLYDRKPAALFTDTVGLLATYRRDRFDLMIGLGDSGFATRGLNYAPLFNAGAGTTVRIVPGHLELGGGAQFAYEPFVEGNRNSSYVSPEVRYEDFLRKEVIKHYVETHPGQEGQYFKPIAASQPSTSWRAVGYLGFGDFGPLKWNKFFVSYRRLHPDNFYDEGNFRIYIADLTRDRYQLELGNEALVTIWPERVDLAWGVLYGDDTNFANTIAASEDNRIYMSTVVRAQVYLTRTVHVLLEVVLAQEKSKNGNLWREHYDSIFRNTALTPDSRGLEMGDAAVRNTMQFKGGLVLNPTGLGIYARPSIRLLYGVQYSTAQAAFGNGFSESLSQFNEFPVGSERHWHHLISLESEGWF